MCLLVLCAVTALAGERETISGGGSLTPMELLGARIFEDGSFSRPEGVSCASCHDHAQAFQGNNGSSVLAVARGAPANSFGKRNTPSLMYASFTPPFQFIDDKDELTGHVEKKPIGGQFLDGRAATLADQFEDPLFDPHEMNAASKQAVVDAIRVGSYSGLARKVFGNDIFADSDQAFTKFSQAVAAFESSGRFHPFASKFDDYLRGKAQLTAVEQKGFALFKDPKKGNCLACHVGKETSRNPQDWLFTDYSYDVLGAPKNPAIPASVDVDLGLCRQPSIEKNKPADFNVETVCGAFKVPTLRNVAITAPYFHNGFFTKLRDVVAFYATRDTDPKRWYPLSKTGETEKFNDLPKQYHNNVNVAEAPYDRKLRQRPRLTQKEVTAITVFLETLTDRRRE
jgi:cytochrome c peroxidase